MNNYTAIILVPTSVQIKADNEAEAVQQAKETATNCKDENDEHHGVLITIEEDG